jgi:hypothetical protein
MINKRNGRFEIESEGRKRNHKWEIWSPNEEEGRRQQISRV